MQWVLLYSWHRQKCIRGAESGGNLPFNTISALLCYQLTNVAGRVQRAPSLLRGWGVKIWVTPQICGHSGEQGWDFLLPGGSALITASASPEAPSDLFEPLRILYNPIVCIHFRATLCWIIQIQKKTTTYLHSWAFNVLAFLQEICKPIAIWGWSSAYSIRQPWTRPLQDWIFAACFISSLFHLPGK